jgi:hypothetical protein
MPKARIWPFGLLGTSEGRSKYDWFWFFVYSYCQSALGILGAVALGCVGA